MRKRCPHCGQFLNNKLHGACLKCIRSGKKLPPALNALRIEYEKDEFFGKAKKSVRGIINAASTLAYDGDWWAVKWNPVSNLRKVIDTANERPYLNPSVVEEINGLIEEAEKE
jgi:hypothetical protein